VKQLFYAPRKGKIRVFLRNNRKIRSKNSKVHFSRFWSNAATYLHRFLRWDRLLYNCRSSQSSNNAIMQLISREMLLLSTNNCVMRSSSLIESTSPNVRSSYTKEPPWVFGFATIWFKPSSDWISRVGTYPKSLSVSKIIAQLWTMASLTRSLYLRKWLAWHNRCLPFTSIIYENGEYFFTTIHGPIHVRVSLFVDDGIR